MQNDFKELRRTGQVLYDVLQHAEQQPPRETLAAAGQWLLLAMEDCGQWPSVLVRRADEIMIKLLARGSLEATIAKMGEDVAKEVLDELMRFTNLAETAAAGARETWKAENNARGGPRAVAPR
jgi:hypothetical protein